MARVGIWLKLPIPFCLRQVAENYVLEDTNVTRCLRLMSEASTADEDRKDVACEFTKVLVSYIRAIWSVPLAYEGSLQWLICLAVFRYCMPL